MGAFLSQAGYVGWARPGVGFRFVGYAAGEPTPFGELAREMAVADACCDQYRRMRMAGSNSPGGKGCHRTQMPIPELDAEGLLPVGIHDCTLEEIKNRFGRFRINGRRHQLFAQLESYAREMQSSGLARAVIVNGSFATGKEDPNDVDIMAVLPEDHDVAGSLRPFQYNLLSRRRVERRFGLDLKVARAASVEYDEFVRLYRQVRNRPDLQKGYLRVSL